MQSQRLLSLFQAAFMTAAFAYAALAQEIDVPVPPPEPGGPDVVFHAEPGHFGFISMTEINGQVVKGAPFSAQVTTETTQTLSDGNQIQRTENGQIYRDSQGRTRREHTFAMLGPWSASSGPHQMIGINDPVAGVHYMLDPERKTAMKMPAPNPEMKNLRKKLGTMHEQEGESTTESLGAQTMEGVAAQGTRVTETIPAGKIGNARPIVIVTERWYSPQLQTVILSKRNDPRFGETIYKLTNISTAEPSPDLFQVPAEYTVKEGTARMRRFSYVPAPK